MKEPTRDPFPIAESPPHAQSRRGLLACLSLFTAALVSYGPDDLMAQVPESGEDNRIQVASLHPIIGDLARSIGKDAVVVTELLPTGGNPHRFEPTASDLRKLSEVDLVLASGKRMESYLPKVAAVLTKKQPLVEVGKRIPSLRVDTSNPMFICCPSHAQGGLDPHWWHSPRHMGRAARYVAEALTDVAPDKKAMFEANAKAYAKEMDELSRWIKKEVGRIPRGDRKLATAHLAYNYFCHEFGFRYLGIQGLSQSQNPTPSDLAAAVQSIEKQKVVAIFPEFLANDKLIQMIHRETGVKVGDTLIADTLTATSTTYEDMMRHNVNAIVRGLTQKSSTQKPSE